MVRTFKFGGYSCTKVGTVVLISHHNREPPSRQTFIPMDSPYFRTEPRGRVGKAGKAGKKRLHDTAERVAGQKKTEAKQAGFEWETASSSCPSSETVMTKSEKPVRRSARWRYSMELPEEGDDDCADKLWDFIGAHAEDKRRKKPCVLATKVWKTLSQKVMGGYEPREGGEVDGIPVAMPGRLASWRRGGKRGQIRWTNK